MCTSVAALHTADQVNPRGVTGEEVYTDVSTPVTALDTLQQVNPRGVTGEDVYTDVSTPVTGLYTLQQVNPRGVTGEEVYTDVVLGVHRQSDTEAAPSAPTIRRVCRGHSKTGLGVFVCFFCSPLRDSVMLK